MHPHTWSRDVRFHNHTIPSCCWAPAGPVGHCWCCDNQRCCCSTYGRRCSWGLCILHHLVVVLGQQLDVWDDKRLTWSEIVQGRHIQEDHGSPSHSQHLSNLFRPGHPSPDTSLRTRAGTQADAEARRTTGRYDWQSSQHMACLPIMSADQAVVRARTCRSMQLWHCATCTVHGGSQNRGPHVELTI